MKGNNYFHAFITRKEKLVMLGFFEIFFPNNTECSPLVSIMSAVYMHYKTKIFIVHVHYVLLDIKQREGLKSLDLVLNF